MKVVVVVFDVATFVACHRTKEGTDLTRKNFESFFRCNDDDDDDGDELDEEATFFAH